MDTAKEIAKEIAALKEENKLLGLERERARFDAAILLSLAYVVDPVLVLRALRDNNATTEECTALHYLSAKITRTDRPGDLINAIRRVLHYEGTAARGTPAAAAAIRAGLGDATARIESQHAEMDALRARAEAAEAELKRLRAEKDTPLAQHLDRQGFAPVETEDTEPIA